MKRDKLIYEINATAEILSVKNIPFYTVGFLEAKINNILEGISRLNDHASYTIGKENIVIVTVPHKYLFLSIFDDPRVGLIIWEKNKQDTETIINAIKDRFEKDKISILESYPLGEEFREGKKKLDFSKKEFNLEYSIVRKK